MLTTEMIRVAVLLVAIGALFILALAVYGAYLHPAWRRQRRVCRACRQAFPEGNYTLLRIHLTTRSPSGLDAFAIGPFREMVPSRYFTYRIESDASPELSGLSPSDRERVRRYLHRDQVPPNHGRVSLDDCPGFFGCGANVFSLTYLILGAGTKR